jgi:hypothetical protein
MGEAQVGVALHCYTPDAVDLQSSRDRPTIACFAILDVLTLGKAMATVGKTEGLTGMLQLEAVEWYGRPEK